MERRAGGPPMRPSDEADERTLRMAREQGQALERAPRYMTEEAAHDGAEKRARDFLVGYAVEEAEGMYEMRDGKLEWKEPGEGIGTYRQPYLWHPWLYHHGRNWTVPGDGEYTLRVKVEAPNFARHDRINGRRFQKDVEVECTGVKIRTGRK